MRVNIDEFWRKLHEYVDPYEIPGAIKAFIEAAEDTESYEIRKEENGLASTAKVELDKLFLDVEEI